MRLLKWLKHDTKTSKMTNNSDKEAKTTSTTRDSGSSENIFWGRGYSGTAELRHANLFLKVMIFSLFGLICWQDYSWREHSNHMSEQQTIIFHDQGGNTVAKYASDFRTGPSQEEINSMGWNIVRWIVGAGSNDVDTAWREARHMMTDEFQIEFDKVFGKRREMLLNLNVYRRIENANVRAMTEKDLPPGTHSNLSRYDVVVSGTIDTYRLNSKDKLASGPFSYRVRLVPLENRSLDNPTGLLVASIGQMEETLRSESNNETNGNDKPSSNRNDKTNAAGGVQ